MDPVIVATAVAAGTVEVLIDVVVAAEDPTPQSTRRSAVRSFSSFLSGELVFALSIFSGASEEDPMIAFKPLPHPLLERMSLSLFLLANVVILVLSGKQSMAFCLLRLSDFK